MTLKERDVVLVGMDDVGNETIDMPVTRYDLVEDAPAVATDTQANAGTDGLLFVTPKQLQTILLNYKVDVMTGASASAAGKAGLVPAPAAGNQNKFLTGAGTFQEINTTNIVNQALGGVGNLNVNVSSATQGAINPSAASVMPATYQITVPNVSGGLAAGTYTILGLLQQLVNLSHRHTAVTVSGTNCNCNCSDHSCGDGGSSG